MAPVLSSAPPPPAPPLPPRQRPTTVPPDGPSAAAKAALPIRSIAEEAAAKAKELHLQSLRKKVYGNRQPCRRRRQEIRRRHSRRQGTRDERGRNPPPKEDEPGLDSQLSRLTVADSAAQPAAPPGLQSPTTGKWKDGSSDVATADAASLRETLQSPTSTKWKPSDVEPPRTTLHGSMLVPASPEEIAAIEEKQTIREVPEEEEEADEGQENELGAPLVPYVLLSSPRSMCVLRSAAR